jgi:hypothetical protein
MIKFWQNWSTRSEILKLTDSTWNKVELSQQRKESITVPTYKRVHKMTVVIIEEYLCYQIHIRFMKFIQYSCFRVNSILRRNY